MRNSSFKIRQITDASVIVALYAIFLLISRLTGSLLESDLFFIMPLPIAIYAYKYDLKTTLIPFVSASIIAIFLCTNPINALVYVLPGLVIGSIHGGLFSKIKINRWLNIFILTLLSSITEVLSAVVLSNVLGVENIFDSINYIVNLINDGLSSMNISSFNLTLLKSIMQGLIPSIILIISLMDAVVFYLLFILFIQRTKIKKDDFDFKEKFNFNSQSPVFGVIYIFIVIASFISVSFYAKSEGFLYILFTVIINAFVILSFVFAYFGYKFLILVARIYNKKWLIIIAMLGVIILFPIVAFIGVIDNIGQISVKLIGMKNNENTTDKNL